MIEDEAEFLSCEKQAGCQELETQDSSERLFLVLLL